MVSKQAEKRNIYAEHDMYSEGIFILNKVQWKDTLSKQDIYREEILFEKGSFYT